MKVLLDTHAFIWWDADPNRLSSTVLKLFEEPKTELVLSVASIWEMVIKQQTGKLSWHVPLEDKIAAHVARGLQVLPVLDKHVLHVSRLPPLHKDPFDRLLISAAISEGIPLISEDSRIAQYPVTKIW